MSQAQEGEEHPSEIILQYLGPAFFGLCADNIVLDMCSLHEQMF